MNQLQQGVTHRTNFINGQWVDSEQCIEVENPATGELIGTIACATSEQVDEAVSAARQCHELRLMADMAPYERMQLLHAIAAQIRALAKQGGELLCLENGKPLSKAEWEFEEAARYFEYYAGMADKIEGKSIPLGEGLVDFTEYEPFGVSAQVIPWNFPLLMLAWKIAPALAAGNTVVLKPAETTPLTALLFAEICQQAELPPGVVNIVTGAGATGEALVSHPRINKVAFTGSTAVGRKIAQILAGSPTKLTLELGGKGANIIFDDAAIDQAIEGVVNGIFFNQGHVCCAGSRLLVQENIHDDVVARLQKRLSTLRLGDPLDKNTDIGAVNSRAQLERITEIVNSGDEEGATRWSAECEIPAKGFWFPPTVFTDVQTSHRVARDEIFGPVLSVLTFRTPDEAVAKANNTPYGLSAGIWTEKASRMLAIADKLRAGVIWANTFNKFDPASPFGGYKESGYGREGGRHGLFPYLESADWMKGGR